MLTSKNLLLSVVLTATLLCAASGRTQTQRGADQSPTAASGPHSAAAPITTVDQAIDRIVAREREEIATFWRYDPVVEIYIQDMKPDAETEAAPVSDHYFLGSGDLAKGVVDRRFLSSDKEREGRLIGRSASRRDGNFVKMAYMDPNGFDRQHYEFEFVRREFLGEVRCLVFDVTPMPDSGEERFRGRIWAEDQNFTIVRFNGVHTSKAGTKEYEVHFDSWRFNVQPRVWLPSYIYAQESDGKRRDPEFKAQIRFWGYGLKSGHGEEEFQEAWDASSAAGGREEQEPSDASPLEAERNWQRGGAQRTIDELQLIGLIAPRGEIDQVMETVVNNLEVTNNLDIQPEIQCRTLLTTTLESFSVGHTIVLSRGLLDALPDEASLAAMLAQEMATILAAAPEKPDGKLHDGNSLASFVESGHFTLKYSDSEIQSANQKALELLRNSPYKNKLDGAGLFLEQVGDEYKVLSALISPRVGERAHFGNELAGQEANRRTAKSDRFVAARMGTRVKLDPWSNQVVLLKAKPTTLQAARENPPFELFPLFPFLTRNQGGSITTANRGGATTANKGSTAPTKGKSHPLNSLDPKARLLEMRCHPRRRN